MTRIDSVGGAVARFGTDASDRGCRASKASGAWLRAALPIRTVGRATEGAPEQRVVDIPAREHHTNVQGQGGPGSA